MGVTRTVKTLRLLNQREGFDCPGCAWPEPDAERAGMTLVGFLREGSFNVYGDRTRVQRARSEPKASEVHQGDA